MKNFILILVLLITGLTMNSLNAQTSWTLQTNPLVPDLSGRFWLGKVQFVSATEGWISASESGKLLHTTNAGATWTIVPVSGGDVVLSSFYPYGGLSFISPTTGWVMKNYRTTATDSYGAVVYKTTDGGLSWQKQIILETVGWNGLQLQFFDANNGWASVINLAGASKYYKTSDGGITWNLISTENSLKNCHFIDSNNGWAIDIGFPVPAGPPYKIYHTSNGGASWEIQYEDNTTYLQEIQFTDLNNGWAVGDQGKILNTNNGGLNWNVVTNAGLTTDSFTSCAYFLNANIGWIANAPDYIDPPFIIHTTNGGASWTVQNIQDINYSNAAIYSFSFWDVNHGWFTAAWGVIGQYSNPLSVEENNFNKSISVYPNPNNGKFSIVLKNPTAKMQMEVFNLGGQKVYESSNLELKKAIDVDLTAQSKGVYFIKINDGENSYTEKIVIR